MDQIAAKEQEYIGEAEEDRNPRGSRAGDKLLRIDQDIHQRKVFHLDWQETKEQHFVVGEQSRIGEEEREVEIGVGGVSGQQTGNPCADHANAIIEIEFDLSPAIFKAGADHIIEIQRKEREER